MDRNVFIVAPDPRSISRVIRRLSESVFSWAYLGQRIDQFHRIQQRFEGQGSYLDTTAQFHEASLELREPYLSFVYDIGRTLNSLRWWITSSAQKNTYICKTFHHACYLKVGLGMARSWKSEEALVLVVAASPVRKALRLNLLQDADTRVTFIEPRRLSMLRSGCDLINMVARRSYFVLRESYQIFLAWRGAARVMSPAEPITLLISYVTTDTMRRGGQYHEYYYGDLAARLGQLGRRVALVPIILRDVGQKKALEQLRDTELSLLVPHRYLNPMDVVRVAFLSMVGPSAPSPLASLADMDIAPLIEEELRYYWKSNRAADTMLMAALISRWADSGFSIEQIIYIYENQPWERAFCWETKRILPETVLTGYQHARVPMLLLNFYLASGGEAEAPKPDWVVTVGEISARQMLKDGHQEGQIRVGGALQMQALVKMRMERAESSGMERPTVLITPSNGLEEAAELVYLAVNLFCEEDGVDIVIKCHPLAPFQMINFAADSPLPKHVEVSDRPVTELMQQSTLMVYSGSTVGIQALALGLPMVHLRPQFDLDLDPLETVPEARLEATGLVELQERVRWLLAHREEYVAQHEDEWQRLAQDFYGPVTEDTFQAFIK